MSVLGLGSPNLRLAGLGDNDDFKVAEAEAPSFATAAGLAVEDDGASASPAGTLDCICALTFFCKASKYNVDTAICEQTGGKRASVGDRDR